MISLIKLLLWKKRRYPNVRLSDNGYIDGNVMIGDFTYINERYRIVTGPQSAVTIGSHCAIGRNFNAASRTHDLRRPTSDEHHGKHLVREASIKIGNCVWIGDNVVIKEGIMIEDYAIIGANSIVTKNVSRFEIVGGNPAIHIKFNTEHYLYNRSEDDN